MPLPTLSIPHALVYSAYSAISQQAESTPVAEAEADALKYLSPQRMEELFEKYGIPGIKAAILLVIGMIVAGWLARVVRNLCARSKLDITLGRFLGSVVKWAVIAAVIVMCLSSFNVQVASFVAIMGSIGVAIGLALQGSLSHIASGVMLLIFRPFKVGDVVTAGGQTGLVDEISLFSTHLNTPDNRRIIIPNGAIVGNVIVNSTFYDMRVIDVTVNTAGSVPQERSREVLLRAAEAVPNRSPERDPRVMLTATAPSPTWVVSIGCQTSDADAMREKLLLACTTAIAAAEIGPTPAVQLVKQV